MSRMAELAEALALLGVVVAFLLGALWLAGLLR